jgi:DnaK suppressor protein
MEAARAQELLQSERARLEQLLLDEGRAGQEDRSAEDETDRLGDRAEPLIAEGTSDAVAAGLRERLAAIDRAEARLAAGTFGRSVRSGRPIPDERLEADPAAELTIEEATEDEEGRLV